MQLKKVQSAYKNQAGAILLITRKMLEVDVPHELLLTAMQEIKPHNAFNNNLATIYN